MIRDTEIKRLILYAKAMGHRVIIRGMKDIEDFGEYCENDKLITINKNAHKNKTELILTLIHEMSHLKYKQLNNVTLTEAFTVDNPNKKQRQEIRDFEVNSLQLFTNIVQELEIKVPMYKILRARDMDIFRYEYYASNSDFPAPEIEKTKWNELKERYKK